MRKLAATKTMPVMRWSEVQFPCAEKTSYEADLSVFAAVLVTSPRGSAEAVEVSLFRLPFAVERSESVFETDNAEPVRVTVPFRFALSPCVVASYALVHHHRILCSGPPVWQFVAIKSAAICVPKVGPLSRAGSRANGPSPAGRFGGFSSARYDFCSFCLGVGEYDCVKIPECRRQCVPGTPWHARWATPPAKNEFGPASKIRYIGTG